MARLRSTWSFRNLISGNSILQFRRRPHQSSIPDPLVNAVHSVLAGEVAAKTIAITGCGPIGLFSIAVARAVGAAQVFAIEVNEHRRRLAEKMDAALELDAS